MLEYISGTVKTVTPTYVVIDNNGIGYVINITLHTCEQLKENTDALILVHEIIREDTHDLYGFVHEEERRLFRLLISVSGVGANTARVILSKLQTDELVQAIVTNDVKLIQSVKGIGAKSAQRVIVDLQDKVTYDGIGNENNSVQDNTLMDEALSALVMLGFAKNTVEKQIKKIIQDEGANSVEEIVKVALRRL